MYLTRFEQYALAWATSSTEDWLADAVVVVVKVLVLRCWVALAPSTRRTEAAGNCNERIGDV